MKKVFIGDLIKDVSVAINRRDIRPALTHLRVRCKPDRIIFTGTDGIKLVEKTHPSDTGRDMEILIPSALVKGYADLNWHGTNAIRDNLLPMLMHNRLKSRHLSADALKYPSYEALFRFSHRKGNIRKTIERQPALDALKAAIPSLDREDNCRFALTELGWGIGKDVNGVFLYQILKGLRSDKLLVRSDDRHPYISLLGDNERALLTMVKRVSYL
jgi:DNA polymerase III sliding clamp (beta) subunit (PCNA family)